MNTSTILAARALLDSNVESFLIRLLIILFVCGLLAYVLSESPIQDPWRRWIRIVLIAVPVAYIIFFLLSFL